MSGGEAGIVGGWWLVEPFIFVVCLVGVQDSGFGPALDGAGVHAEVLREFGCGEQAVGAEPVGVAGRLLLRRVSSTMRAVNGLPSPER